MNTFNLFFAALVCGLPCALAPGWASSQETMRTWTDRSGNFQVEATMTDLVNGEVKLRKDSGDLIHVPLKKLSADDRRYVAIEIRRRHLVKQQKERILAAPIRPNPIAIDRDFGPLPNAMNQMFDTLGKMDSTIREPDPPVPAKPVYEPLLQRLSEAELSAQLAAQTPAVDLYRNVAESRELISSLDPDQGLRAAQLEGLKGKLPEHTLIAELTMDRSDLAGLPMRMGADCQLDDESAKTLQTVSSELGSKRSSLDRPTSILQQVQSQLGNTPDRAVLRSSFQRQLEDRDRRLIAFLRDQRDWQQPAAVSGLVQTLQAETPAVRRQLIEILANIDGPQASIALAKRAVFDLSADNRAAATDALKRRSAEEFRAALLDAFDYPWAPAAIHAAEALVRLNDQDAVANLAQFLDQPSPHLPQLQSDSSYGVRELVKVNHMRNCLLCHEASTDEIQLVRGRIPYPDESLSVAYYQSKQGSFVRADRTYLRQDFSVTQPVVDAGPWPEMQRHDYLVRMRPLSTDEAKRFTKRLGQLPNQQRAAALFALRKLTKKNLGDSADKWQKLAAN